MFTGLVLGTGRVHSHAPQAGGVRLWLEAGPLAGEVSVGDSVAVDGCCLTVVAREAERIGFDVVPETLSRTTLGGRGPGTRVNLELPLRPSDRLGGHFVQGHVDAVTTLLERRDKGAEVVFWLATPAAHRGQIVEKGSVALDGVSLTVAGVAGDRFSVALIPHTLEVTTLGERRAGDRLNFEADILAKYVAALGAGR